MKGLEGRYSDKGLKVIWIGFQDRKDKIMEFMRKHNINAGVVFDKGNIVARKYGIRYGAGLVMVDAEGVVKARVPKGFSERRLLEAINKVFKKDKAEKLAHNSMTKEY